MKTNVLRYNIVINKEDDVYIVHVPTLGISDFGKTIDLAKNNTAKAIKCHIEGLRKSGEDIPTPDIGEYYVSHMDVSIPSGYRVAI